MKPAAQTIISLVFLLAFSAQAQTSNPNAVLTAQDQAVQEAARRQSAMTSLETALRAADAAKKRNEMLGAATIYQDAVVKLFPSLQFDNPKMEAEKKQVIAGLDETRENLARQYMKMHDYAAAGDQVGVALKFDPNNEHLRALKKEIDLAAAAQVGRVPSPDMLRQMPSILKTNEDVATLVENGRMLYEMGHLDEAEKVFLQAEKLSPANTAAPYYLDLLKEARYMSAARDRERDTKSEMVTVERTWLLSTTAEDLPHPGNPYATNIDIFTGPGRKVLQRKLREIKFNALPGPFEQALEQGLPLSQVLRNLKAISVSNDLEGVGVNFMFNPRPGAPEPAAADAALAPTAPGIVPVDQIIVTINPPLNNVTLSEALDAICQVAVQGDNAAGISYSVEDYAVWFFKKAEAVAAMETRTFHVDPNTFIQGLQGVVSSILSGQATSSGLGGSSGGGIGGGGYGGGGIGGIGGGSYGGGGIGGIGGGLGGIGGGIGGYGGGGIGGIGGGQYGGGQFGGGGGQFGGGQYGGGGGGAGSQVQGSASYPTVSIAPTSTGGAGGAGGGTNLTGGIPYVTSPREVVLDNQLIFRYFTNAGVNISSNGAFAFFNSRSGDLLVRATKTDMEIVEKTLELLNKIPPEVQIDAKFASVTQNDAKGIGFQTFLGNFTTASGAIGMQGGTAPSYTGPSTYANPSGIFPGAGPVGANPGQVSPAASDGSLTSAALRTVAPNAPISAPSLATLATITGIMTEPQFRVAIQAIEQRDGTDILSAPRVTTLSGRQAHVSVSDIVDIVTYPDIIPGGLSSLTTGTGVGTGSTTSATTAPVVTYTTTPFTEGPALDVLPTISADGFSIQMVLIPTLTEFVGYDPPGQFIPQVSSLQGVPLVAQLPLPHYRVREVITSVNLWDGQTVLLGGLISENISKMKDKVPVLGDLPLLGRFFKSEYSYSQKANLMVFVTATIIDPAGNRMHTDEEMPFAKTMVPAQPTAPMSR